VDLADQRFRHRVLGLAGGRGVRVVGVIAIPLRTGNGLNGREHWRARSRRVKAERETVAWGLKKVQAPLPPCCVVLTRLGPSRGLDDDNLAGSLKAVRDQVADWLGIDDRHSDLVRYRYAQRRAKDWAVTIEFREEACEQQS